MDVLSSAGSKDLEGADYNEALEIIATVSTLGTNEI